MGRRTEWAWLLLAGTLLVADTVCGQSVVAGSDHDVAVSRNDRSALPTGHTWMCEFSYGPRANQRGSLADIPGAAPVRIGGYCSDGESFGMAVAAGPSSDATRVWEGAITNLGTARATSTICQFMSGPKAHGWHDYAPFEPVPVGSGCDDGAGSAGFVVPKGYGDRR
jgi:hypothetical protein